MAAVAQRGAIGGFAGAKKHRFVFIGDIFDGREHVLGLVATIAKWLVFGEAAAAPPIGLACFDLYGKGRVATACWLCHDVASISGV
jgi:hypothetical protein